MMRARRTELADREHLNVVRAQVAAINLDDFVIPFHPAHLRPALGRHRMAARKHALLERAQQRQ